MLKAIAAPTGGATPTGPAGGDLSGTYPNPNLAWVSRSATQTLNIGAGGTLGSAAFANTGTSGANVPLLNGANVWSLSQTFTLAPVFTDQSGTRTALGLGTAATQNTGTSGANVPLLNGANTWAATQTFTLAPVFTAQAGTRTALGLGSLSTVNGGTGVATALGNTAGGAGGFALVGTTPPTGAAGGDLSGTYPNPTLAWVSRSAAQTLNIGAGGTLGSAAFQSTGTSGANVPLLNGANTWSTTQTFTLAPVFTDQSGSRTALGLGTAATQNTGTSGATVPLLNGANTWASTQTFTLAPVFTNQSGSRTALGLGTAATQNTGTSGANVPLLNGANTWATTQTFTAAPVFTDASGSRTALGLSALATTVPGTGVATALGNTAGGAGGFALVGSTPPTGSAGGDLTGTYPNPTLGSVIVAGGPTGSATVAPIITYDAKGRLTAVSSATITPAIGSVTGLGTGVATALGVAVGSAGAPVVNGGALGTPSSGVGTNLTALDASKISTGTLSTARLPLTSATFQSGAISPAGTTSTTFVMMGLGGTCTLTPTYSSRVKLEFVGVLANNTATGIVVVGVRYGTGAAPSNGAADTGTTLASAVNGTADANNSGLPFFNGGIITGLTPGVAYWFDVAIRVNGGTGSVSNVTCNAYEF